MQNLQVYLEHKAEAVRGERAAHRRVYITQEMAEKRNDEESVAKKQYELDKLRIDELSLKQEGNPTTVSRLFVTQIQDLPEQE